MGAQTVARDAAGLAVLQECSAAAGTSDMTTALEMSGTVTDPTGEGQPFVYEHRAIGQTRYTVTTSAGPVVHVVNQGHGQVQLANGNVIVKPDASVRYAWPQLAPALLCAWPLGFQEFSIQYVGTATVGNSQADQLRISFVVPEQDGKADEIEALLSGADLYLDSTTHLPVRLTTRAFGMTGIQNSLAIDTYYSSYGQYQGLSFPAQINEYANGVLSRSITVTSVQINPTFPDSDFSMEAK
jgi:hypothetical protein